MKYYTISNKNKIPFEGKRKFSFYIIAFLMLLLTDYLLYSQMEMYKNIIKTVIYLVAFEILIDVFIRPSNNTYIEFEKDYLELGFQKKKHTKRIYHTSIDNFGIKKNELVVKSEGKLYKIPLSNYSFDEVHKIKSEVKSLIERFSSRKKI